MVKWKSRILDLGIRPVDETRDGKVVGFVYRTLARYWLNHRSYDNIGVDHCKVKARVVGFNKVPGLALSLGFRNVVAQNCVFVLDRLFRGYLDIYKRLYEELGFAALTGFQSFSVYGRPSRLRSSKELRTETALPKRTKRLNVIPPWRWALSRICVVLGGSASVDRS